MPKMKYQLVWGILSILIFITLLMIRLEIFSSEPVRLPAEATINLKQASDSWMNIYQNKNKIGTAHRTFSARDKGFQFAENVFLRINTMGITQALNISTEGELNPDMTISSFNFKLTSSLFHFQAHGFVEKDKLIFFSGSPNAQQKNQIILKGTPYISGSIYNAAFRANMEKEKSRSFSIFDPSTMGTRSIKVTRHADEIITIMSKRTFTQKYCADFMGAKNCSWIDKNGEILKETGMLGLSMEKVSLEEAKKGIAKDGNIDFTEIASIPANLKIDKAEELNQIKIAVSGIAGHSLHLNGDRQQYHGNILTITKEQIPSILKEPARDAYPAFLNQTPLVQTGHPQIKDQLNKIIRPDDSPQEKVRKIVGWVYRNIDKKPVLSVPNALEVLQNRQGDCNEHAVLVAALLRTAGIPTQIETGLIYLRGKWYYHAWNAVWLGKWISVDAVFNQIPADVTHIRLIRGESSEQLDLMGVMGKIKLEILEQRK